MMCCMTPWCAFRARRAAASARRCSRGSRPCRPTSWRRALWRACPRCAALRSRATPPAASGWTPRQAAARTCRWQRWRSTSCAAAAARSAAACRAATPQARPAQRAAASCCPQQPWPCTSRRSARCGRCPARTPAASRHRLRWRQRRMPLHAPMGLLPAPRRRARGAACAARLRSTRPGAHTRRLRAETRIWSRRPRHARTCALAVSHLHTPPSATFACSPARRAATPAPRDACQRT